MAEHRRDRGGDPDDRRRRLRHRVDADRHARGLLGAADRLERDQVAGLVRIAGAQAQRLVARRRRSARCCSTCHCRSRSSAALALCGVGAAMAPPTIWIEALAISGLLFVLLVLVRWRIGRAQTSAASPPAIRPDGLLARGGPRLPCRFARDRGRGSLLPRPRAETAPARWSITALATRSKRWPALDGLRVHRGAWAADAAVTAGQPGGPALAARARRRPQDPGQRPLCRRGARARMAQAPEPDPQAGCSASTVSTSLMNASVKAGMSSGLRLVTILPSTTASSSTTSAPALARSVRTEGQLVTVTPSTTSASTSSHGP